MRNFSRRERKMLHLPGWRKACGEAANTPVARAQRTCSMIEMWTFVAVFGGGVCFLIGSIILDVVNGDLSEPVEVGVAMLGSAWLAVVCLVPATVLCFILVSLNPWYRHASQMIRDGIAEFERETQEEMEEDEDRKQTIQNLDIHEFREVLLDALACQGFTYGSISTFSEPTATLKLSNEERRLMVMFWEQPRPVDLSAVEAFCVELLESDCNEGLVVSRSGFTSEASEYLMSNVIMMLESDAIARLQNGMLI